MEEKQSHLTQRILQLTLEIVYLLTGENYIALKLCNSLVAPSLKEMHSILTEAPPPSLIPERRSNKKFQEVTEEMIELLTREEPCELYKAAMMEEEPTLTSPDGARKRNPSETCPRPLYSQDSAQEEHSTAQDHQEEDLNVAEVKEEAEEEERGAEEEISPQIGTDSRGSTDNRLHFTPAEEDDRTVKSEMKEKEEPNVRGAKWSAEDGLYPELGTAGQPGRNNMEELHFFISADGKIEAEVTEDSPGESLLSPNLHPDAHGEVLSSDPSRHGESFLNPSHLISHHGSHKRFPCSKCGRCFNRRAKLLSHKRRHLREAPYLCSKCGKGFTLKEDLLDHFQLHTEDKSYLCSYCKKPFPGRSCLERHELIHTGQKPYSCAVCGIRCTQKANLARHERTHTGEKPFSCPECGKCFTRKATMIEHWQLHKCRLTTGNVISS